MQHIAGHATQKGEYGSWPLIYRYMVNSEAGLDMKILNISGLNAGMLYCVTAGGNALPDDSVSA